MYDNARLLEKSLMSICQRATAATVIGYKVSHLRAPEKLIDVIELGFLLITTISSHLVLLFFLIKSQQRCYLTLIWSQLNPCLNLWRCGAHSNLLSIQPLTPLRLVSWLWVCWSESLDALWSEELPADQANKVIQWKYNQAGRFTGVHRLRFSTTSLCFITRLRERGKLLTHRGTAKPLHIPIDHRSTLLQVAFPL